MRQITKEGDLNVWDRPQDVDLVTILLSAKVVDTEEYFEKDLQHEFKMEDGFFCPAVKRVVKQMKQGEAVRVKVPLRPASSVHVPVVLYMFLLSLE